MAPKEQNATLRNRKQFLNDTAGDDNDAALERVLNNSKPVSKLSNDEVAIDGFIYDISTFNHPGGDVVKMFGGNDVTVQYHMIHPRHGNKQVEKMKLVGKVDNWKAEYSFDTPFAREMKEEVYKIVSRKNEFGTPGYLTRAAFYTGLMFYLTYRWVVDGSSFKLAVALGVSQALIGLNVQHDANHGAASRKVWVNDLLGFGANLIGGDKWNWMQQHWTHHSFTNHHAKDPDSFSSEPVFNFNDYPKGHPNRKWYMRFQGFYFLFMLSFYWFSSVFNSQKWTLQHAGAAYVGIKMENDFTVNRRIWARLLGLNYLFLHVCLPFYQHGLSWEPAAHVAVLGIASSLVLSTLFTLSHNFENSDRDPTKEFRENGKEVCWFKSQVETSSTYGGFISGCLTGGLNCQVEHHLFPRMSSAWYPFIRPTVQRVCKKHGVRYVYYPWIIQNLISTIKYMHAAGTGANWELDPLSGNA